MNDKTPPYVIDFDDIREGMTIEREWKVGGEIRFRAEAVADHLGEDDTAWLTPDGYLVANDKGAAVLRVLAEPPNPAPPSEVGSVVLVDGVAYYWEDREQAWISIDDARLDLTPQAMASKAWALAKIVPADDPTAPKAADGLRERVEQLAKAFRAATRSLTETSADA